jgi:hypothetical protein
LTHDLAEKVLLQSSLKKISNQETQAQVTSLIIQFKKIEEEMKLIVLSTILQMDRI